MQRGCASSKVVRGSVWPPPDPEKAVPVKKVAPAVPRLPRPGNAQEPGTTVRSLARGCPGTLLCGWIRATANPGEWPSRHLFTWTPAFQNSPEKKPPYLHGQKARPSNWAFSLLRRRLTANRDRLNTSLKCFQHKPPISLTGEGAGEGTGRRVARHLLKAIEGVKQALADKLVTWSRAGRQVGREGLCEATAPVWARPAPRTSA